MIDRPIFLVGFMGSGKTRVGKPLARRLDLPFVDADACLEEEAGRPVPRIIREDGEAAFRRLESDWIARTAGGGPVVASTGGGAFLRRLNRRVMLDAGLVVWLDVALPEIRRRLDRARVDRPLWPQGDALAQRRLWSRRRAAYALAHLRVSGNESNPSRIADRAARAVLGRISD